MWLADPHHPGLHFERIRGRRELCSVRITRSYRAVGVYDSPDKVTWFWIGPHSEYDRLLRGR